MRGFRLPVGASCIALALLATLTACRVDDDGDAWLDADAETEVDADGEADAPPCIEGASRCACHGGVSTVERCYATGWAPSGESCPEGGICIWNPGDWQAYCEMGAVDPCE